MFAIYAVENSDDWAIFFLVNYTSICYFIFLFIFWVSLLQNWFKLFEISRNYLYRWRSNDIKILKNFANFQAKYRTLIFMICCVLVIEVNGLIILINIQQLFVYHSCMHITFVLNVYRFSLTYFVAIKHDLLYISMINARISQIEFSSVFIPF